MPAYRPDRVAGEADQDRLAGGIALSAVVARQGRQIESPRDRLDAPRTHLARRPSLTRCPILGAEREQPGEVGSDAVARAQAALLTCRYVSDHECIRPESPVVVPDVVGSNPIAHPDESAGEKSWPG